MTMFVAFLRGINLGKRQMKMAELRACLEEAGFGAVKTILASGNARFEAEGAEKAVKLALEKAMAERFDYPVKAVLRTAKDIETMLESHPFDALPPEADVARHVLLSDKPLPDGLELEGEKGDTEILRIDRRELYVVGYRRPNGRYTGGVDAVLKPLYARTGKDHLDTMRNWNTMEKLLK